MKSLDIIDVQKKTKEDILKNAFLPYNKSQCGSKQQYCASKKKKEHL